MSQYDLSVMADAPVAFYRMDSPHTGVEHNFVAAQMDGVYRGDTCRTLMPNGDIATVLDGYGGHLEVADADALSISTTGALTIEAWIRPDTVEPPSTDGGYVHWLGKGSPGQHEYVMRVYPASSPDRPCRISAYAFNAVGGLGAGSYFQLPIVVGAWVHVAAVYDLTPAPGYPTGSVAIYRNGLQMDRDPLADYAIVPSNGTAPLRIGTRDLKSYFCGAIGKVAVYGHAVAASRLAAHYTAMGSV